jgi:Tfp pilus assembly protein PilV
MRRSRPSPRLFVMQRNKSLRQGFALYEVLLGLAIFAVGVVVLGRAVENCLNASSLSEEDNRVRLVLANRMAEIQSSPVHPDASKQDKIDTGYGIVRLVQKSVPEELQEPDNTIITGITRVTLTALWSRNGIEQSKQLVFYVYRAG